MPGWEAQQPSTTTRESPSSRRWQRRHNWASSTSKECTSPLSIRCSKPVLDHILIHTCPPPPHRYADLVSESISLGAGCDPRWGGRRWAGWCFQPLMILSALRVTSNLWHHFDNSFVKIQVGLTDQQAAALFEAIGSWENVRLRKLNVSHNNLASVHKQILARAALRLNEVCSWSSFLFVTFLQVTMYHTSVTKEQVGVCSSHVGWFLISKCSSSY